MLKAIWRPLLKWPGRPTPHTEAVKSPFVAKYQDTLNLLEYELGKLGASNIVIEAQLTVEQIGNDRWPKPGATWQGPAVIVSFTDLVAHGEYSYPCDTFFGWQSNLRAIALALEALRKIDRYGVAKSGEQYKGFLALPPPPDPIQNAADCIASMAPAGIQASALKSSPELFELVYKALEKKLHPDIGGAHADFVKLQQAREVLTKHFSEQAKAGSA